MRRPSMMTAWRTSALAMGLVVIIGGGSATGALQAGKANQNVVSASAGVATTEGYLSRLIRTAQDAPNFGNAIVHHDPRGVTIFGVGYPTPEVKQLLDDAPAGITATWHRCAYTHRDLERETTRLIHTHGGILNQIGPNPYASGLIVGTLNKPLLASYHPGEILGSSYAMRVVRRAPIGGF